jgi:hemoglobin
VKPLRVTYVVLVLASLGLAACMPHEMAMAPAPAAAPPPPPPPPTLYQRLGGQPAIVAVVDDFVANVAHDRRINRYFRHANIPHLKAALVAQICEATGGPCHYTGPSMRQVHHGMHITNRAFNDLVGDLVKTLNKFKVPAGEQKQLLDILGPMRKDIVNV